MYRIGWLDRVAFGITLDLRTILAHVDIAQENHLLDEITFTRGIFVQDEIPFIIQFIITGPARGLLKGFNINQPVRINTVRWPVPNIAVSIREFPDTEVVAR
jgi:hypothetical protein